LDVETLEIPDTVEYIEDCAFDYNATIEKIVLGANVERFSIDCYSGAVLISDIEVPEENPYFQDFGTYVLTEDKAELVFVEPSVRNFVIPKELEDIGKGAFVFSCCLPLASVSVEDGNDTYCVVDGVLYNKDMTTLVFATEEVATEFEVPDTVESIDNFAFSGCSSLETIAVEEGNAVYHSKDNCIINTSKKELIAGCQNSIIPEDGSVTVIGNGAFDHCSTLVSIEIPSTIVRIGRLAFQWCTALTDIKIPSSVTRIEAHSFNGCSELIQKESGISYVDKWVVDCEASVVEVSLRENIVGIAQQAFYGCSSLASIEIPSSVTSIGQYAFYNCSALTSIEIPSGVTNIGEHAFYSCSSLTSIEIPSGVKKIGSYAFSNCGSLEALSVEAGNAFYRSEGNCIIETGRKSLIAGCKNSVIPADGSVTQIYVGAFAGCIGLEAITIPSTVTSIGGSAFYNCKSLTNIEIPSSVVGVYVNAFKGCDNLIQVENGVSYVDKWVVDCDPSITNVSFRENTVGIAVRAFDNCDSMTSITLPSSLTSICNLAFSDCDSLTSIEIPASVTNIGGSAFETCTSLTSITLLSDEPATLGVDAFSGSHLETIYVPASAVDTYKEHEDWAEYKEMIFPSEANGATLSFGEYKVKTGRTVNVSLFIENNPGIAIASIKLNYDKDVFTLKEVENGEIFDTLDTGINLLWSADGNSEDDGVLATLTFEVDENAQEKDYAISAKVNEAYNEDSEKVDIAVLDGKITAYNVIYGDANDDDIVSALDVLLLRKYMANYDYEKGTSSIDVARGADANGDGIVTALDVLLMRKYMANYDYVTGSSTIVLGPQKTEPTPTCRVTFIDHDGTELKVEIVEKGKNATAPAIPVRYGYEFLGWFDSSVGGNKFDLSAPIIKDTEVFAQWKKANIELSCTESEIYTNDEKTVYFYAQIAIDVDSICLYNANTNELICEMFDNGKYSENGDDLQSDGVFSCKINICESDAITYAYYALSDTGISSNQVEISIVLPLTDEEIEEIQDANYTLSEVIANNSDLPEADKAAAVQEILNTLSDEELNDGKAYVNSDSIYYDTENSLVSFEYSNGIAGFIMLEDLSSGENSTAGSSTLTETTAYLLSTAAPAQETATTNSIVKTVGDATIMYSFDDPENSDWLKYYELCKDSWTGNGLITEIHTEPTVEDYKTAFLGSELIVIAEHGGYVTRYNFFSVLDQTSIIFTTEEVSFAKNFLYSKDLISRRIYIAILEDGSCVYCLTPEFFEFYYGEDLLDGSIVYMDNCMGYGQGKNWDYGFADAFITGASAETVYGYHESVYIAYGLLMMDHIVSDLLDGNTTGEAFDNAKETLGNTDVEYAQEYQPHWDISNHIAAIPVISGSSDTVLVNDNFINGSFELELEGWNTTGDVRVINKLAEFIPVDGEKMAILTTGIGSSENEYLEGTEGSLLLQTFEVANSFTKISFSYNVVSEEPSEFVGSKYDDQVTIELLNTAGEVICQLAHESVNSSEWYAVKGINFEGGDETTYCTQWKEVVFEELNEYVGEKITLRIRIWDEGDSIYDTAVLVDDIKVQ